MTLSSVTALSITCDANSSPVYHASHLLSTRPAPWEGFKDEPEVCIALLPEYSPLAQDVPTVLLPIQRKTRTTDPFRLPQQPVSINPTSFLQRTSNAALAPHMQVDGVRERVGFSQISRNLRIHLSSLLRARPWSKPHKPNPMPHPTARTHSNSNPWECAAAAAVARAMVSKSQPQPSTSATTSHHRSAQYLPPHPPNSHRNAQQEVLVAAVPVPQCGTLSFYEPAHLLHSIEWLEGTYI